MKRGRVEASVLVGLLWCIALLAVVVISLLHTARMDLMVVKNHGDKIQAHYLALAGIERAKALLYQNAHDRSRSGRNHSGELYSADEKFRNVRFGRGQYSVFRRARPEEGGGIVYGVADEESRLNLNTASAEELLRLEGFTRPMAMAVVAWRGENSPENSLAANADYYASLQPPSQPRNGPFQSVRELLMVREVSPELLLGDDRQENGLLDQAGDPEAPDSGADALGAGGDLGWAASLTAHSTDRNVNAAGQDRVNIQTATEATLTGVHGITPAIARAIVQYRGRNRFQSIADLLDVTAAQNQGQPGSAAGFTPPPANFTGAPSDGSGGPKLIDSTLFMDLADDVTVEADADQAGLVNVNTAGLEVLMCLPGMNRELAQAIISYRQSAGSLANVASLLKVPGFDTGRLKQIAPRITVRSETYRILSEGRVRSTGTRERIQAIVHVGLNAVQTLAYREGDL